MILNAIFFYVFSAVIVASALMVIAARNPVHSVLFLILAFFNAAGLFILLGAEFLAMILIVVYVGAVAVLFLFVVMMLDVDFAELRQGFLNYLPIGALIGVVLLAELLLVLGGWAFAPERGDRRRSVPIPARSSNTAALGEILYTHYVYLLPGRRPGAAGRHDRRDRADASPPAGRQAPVDRGAGRARPGDGRRGAQGRIRAGVS